MTETQTNFSNITIVERTDDLEDLIFLVTSGNQYDKTIDEYMREEHEPYNGEEITKTSVEFPQPLRLMIDDMSVSSGRSEYKISRNLIEHGFIVMQHRHLKKFKLIGEYSRKYSFGNLTLIKDILNDFEFNISEMVKPKKKSIKIREHIYSGIHRAASWVHMDTSDLIRMCVIYSLSTKSELYPEIASYCNKEILKFENQLKEWTALLEHIPAIKETFDKL
jgi:hypothetical protein